MSTLKVDTVDTRTGTGNITFSRPTVLQAGDIVTADLADDAITLAKMAGGVDGNIISYDASGDPVAVVTGSSGQVLTSAGAGAPPTFAAAAAGGAFTMIGTGTITDNDTSITQTGLSSTYDTYMIAISDITTKTGVLNVYLRLGDSSGVDAGAGNYSYHNQQSGSNSSSYSGVVSNSAAQIIMSFGLANPSNYNAIIWLVQPGDSSNTALINGTYTVDDGTNVTGGAIVAARNAAIAVDRVSVVASANAFASGRLTVWGVSHA
jgi:hypothetical protein